MLMRGRKQDVVGDTPRECSGGQVPETVLVRMLDGERTITFNYRDATVRASSLSLNHETP